MMFRIPIRNIAAILVLLRKYIDDRYHTAFNAKRFSFIVITHGGAESAISK
jgi:hypothetical protein